METPCFVTYSFHHSVHSTIDKTKTLCFVTYSFPHSVHSTIDKMETLCFVTYSSYTLRTRH